MIRNILNLLMILCILVVMNYRYTANVIHEILGLFITLLFIIHNTLNRHWYTAITKGGMRLLCELNTVINLFLIIALLVVSATGVLISQTVFPASSLSGNLRVHQLHTLSAYMLFILISIHLGCHWNALQGKLCRCLKIDRTSFSYIFLSRIASLAIIFYGIYASFTHHIGSKLFLKHVYYAWASAPSLVGFTLDYASIMGCYVAITYYLTKLLKRQKYAES